MYGEVKRSGLRSVCISLSNADLHPWFGCFVNYRCRTKTTGITSDLKPWESDLLPPVKFPPSWEFFLGVISALHNFSAMAVSRKRPSYREQ